MTDSIGDHFRKQAGWCRMLGSPLSGDIVEALADTLDGTTDTGRRISGWEGDPDDDALSIRVLGGFHALARRGTESALSAFYRGEGGNAKTIVPSIVRAHDAWLSTWLNRPPQTNEVMRAAALWPGLMEIARRFGPDMELLELGSSAGLNLNLEKFGYDLGGVRAGDPASPVQIIPEWEGPPPALAAVNILSRAGVDRDPVDLSDPSEVERLTAFVWVGMAERMARLEGALTLAKAHPPQVEKADLVDWLAARLAMPQAAGVTRVVFHSIVFQYIPEASRARVEELLAESGAKATPERPLARLQMEMIDFGRAPELRLQCWPGGGAHEVLAHVHPHGTKISWGAGTVRK